MPLTDQTIARLKWHPSTRMLNDRAGLRIAAHPGGRRTWQLRMSIAGKPAVVTVGAWPEMRVAFARRRARALRQLILAGGDPRMLTRDAKTVTLGTFAKRWIHEVVTRNRKTTKPVERTLKKDILPALGSMPIQKIAFADVRDLVFRKRDLDRPAAAVKLRDTLDRIFRYAVTCGLVAENPVAKLDRRFIARLRPRTRSLTEPELRLFFDYLPKIGARNAYALELLLLTLARKSELLTAQWKDVNFEKQTWEVPAERSKSGLPHIVYLSSRASRLLASLMVAQQPRGDGEGDDYIAGEWYILPAQNSNTQPMAPNVLNKAIGRVRWGMPKFTPHDLRRTGSTILNEKGYQADWIEKALNHSVRGIRGVYNKAQYADQRKKMLEEWAGYLEGLRNG